MSRKRKIADLAVILLPGVITMGINLFSYMVPKQIVSPSRYVFLDMEIDRMIPFVPWFVAFYYLAYAQWFNYFLQVCFGDRRKRNRYFSADILSKIVIFFIFMLWPTAVNRPAVDPEGGLWQWLLSFTFGVDNPLGAFPSIHCFYSWLCFRYSLETEPRERKWLSCVQLLLTIAVFASTVLVKQHYFIDIPGGILFAEAALLIEKHTGIADVFDRAVGRITDKMRLLINEA